MKPSVRAPVLQVPMPGVPQREAILAITLWRHAAEVGATQVDPQLLANQSAAPGEKPPLRFIAGLQDPIA